MLSSFLEEFAPLYSFRSNFLQPFGAAHSRHNNSGLSEKFIAFKTKFEQIDGVIKKKLIGLIYENSKEHKLDEASTYSAHSLVTFAFIDFIKRQKLERLDYHTFKEYSFSRKQPGLVCYLDTLIIRHDLEPIVFHLFTF